MPSITYREAIAAALREELTRDERVFVIGEQIGYASGRFEVTAGMLAEFGERRIRDMPRMDATLVDTAIGAAIGGLVPVVAIRNTALAIAAAERVRRHPDLSIVIRAPLGEHAPRSGASAQIAAWVHGAGRAPRIVAPASPIDAMGMLKSAIQANGPSVLFEDRTLYDKRGEVVNGSGDHARLEGARIIRAGSDLTIIGYSGAVEQAAAAAEILASHGIAAEVIDLRALAPLDVATLGTSIEKTGRAILASAGLAGADAEIAWIIHRRAFAALRAPLQTVAPAHTSAIVEMAMRRG